MSQPRVFQSSSGCPFFRLSLPPSSSLPSCLQQPSMTLINFHTPACVREPRGTVCNRSNSTLYKKVCQPFPEIPRSPGAAGNASALQTRSLHAPKPGSVSFPGSAPFNQHFPSYSQEPDAALGAVGAKGGQDVCPKETTTSVPGQSKFPRTCLESQGHEKVSKSPQLQAQIQSAAQNEEEVSLIFLAGGAGRKGA